MHLRVVVHGQVAGTCVQLHQFDAGQGLQGSHRLARARAVALEAAALDAQAAGGVMEVFNGGHGGFSFRKTSTNSPDAVGHAE